MKRGRPKNYETAAARIAAYRKRHGYARVTVDVPRHLTTKINALARDLRSDTGQDWFLSTNSTGIPRWYYRYGRSPKIRSVIEHSSPLYRWSVDATEYGPFHADGGERTFEAARDMVESIYNIISNRVLEYKGNRSR